MVLLVKVLLVKSYAVYSKIVWQKMFGKFDKSCVIQQTKLLLTFWLNLQCLHLPNFLPSRHSYLLYGTQSLIVIKHCVHACVQVVNLLKRYMMDLI